MKIQKNLPIPIRAIRIHLFAFCLMGYVVGADASGQVCSSAPIYDGVYTIIIEDETTGGGADNFNIGAVPGACTDVEDPCFSLTGSGPDKVIGYVHSEGMLDVLVTLTPVSADLAVYIVTDCDDVPNSYIAIADIQGDGGVETIQFDATAGVTYYIIVDAYDLSVGEYELSVESPTSIDPDIVFVDFAAPAGNNGTVASPVRSLQEALDIVVDGGTIRINGESSVVVGMQTFTGAGTINQNVRIEAAPPGPAGVAIGGDPAADETPQGDEPSPTVSGYITRRKK